MPVEDEQQQEDDEGEKEIHHMVLEIGPLHDLVTFWYKITHAGMQVAE